MIHPMTYSIMDMVSLVPNGKLHGPEFIKEVYCWLRRISVFYRCTVEEMKASNKLRNVAIARHMFFFLVFHFNKMAFSQLTLKEIGAILNRDHSTVVYANNKILDYIEIYDKKIINDFKNILTEDELNQLNLILPPKYSIP